MDVKLVEGDAPYYRMIVRDEFSKTKGRDVSMFWTESYDAIKAWIETKNPDEKPTEPFFKFHYVTCQRILERLGKRVGMKLNCHLFRHSSATHYANKGWNEFKLNKRYGWTQNSDVGRSYVDTAKLDEEMEVKKYEESKLGDLKIQLHRQEEENKMQREEVANLKITHEQELTSLRKQIVAVQEVIATKTMLNKPLKAQRLRAR